MKKIISRKSKLKGKINPPPSKSQTLRAIIFAMLANGKSTIENYLPSPDTLAMLNTIESYGAKVKKNKRSLIITGLNSRINPPSDIIDAKNSGIILRFIGAIAALNNTFSIITGDSSIKKNRVISPLLSGLKQLNVYAESLNQDGRPPIIVKGPIKPNKIKINGEDSQPVSALIIASAFSNGIVEIEVENPGEKPWIELTLNWLDFFNIKYINKDFSYYKIYGNNKIKSFSKTIEPDFSSISFPIIASLITKSSITIEHINFSLPGGDKKFISILQEMGANIEIDKKNNRLHILPSEFIVGKEIDVNDCVDSLPILSVLACFAKGTTILKNARIARFKESDRLYAITNELKKMGANIEEFDDGLVIKRSVLKGAVVSSHGDHRIAMALTIAGFNAEGFTTVEDTCCIKKSYPTFCQDILSIGGEIQCLP